MDHLLGEAATSSKNILYSGDTRIEGLIEKLEETCERVRKDDAISIMRRDPTSATYIPLRIRDIIKETLLPLKREGDAQVGSLTQEKVLKKELQQTKKENQEFSVKYIALSEKVLTLEKEVRELTAQNSHLMQVNREKEDTHSLHLRAYQDGQEGQKTLIQQLHAKIKQYELECAELKAQLQSHSSETLNHGQSEHERTVQRLENELAQLHHDNREAAENHHKELNSAMSKLDEQQKKVVRLAMSNQALRQQLEESQSTNSRLTEDIQQLTAGWNQSQQELKESKDYWKKSLEQETHSTLKSHHLSLAVAKRDAGCLKNEMSIIRNTIERDLSVTQSEVRLLCSRLGALVDEQSRTIVQDKERLKRALQSKEEECSKVAHELLDLKLDYEVQSTKHQLTIQDLQKAVEIANSSLGEAKQSCLEQANAISCLEASNADLTNRRAQLDTLLHEAQATNSSLKRDVDILKSGLEQIVQVMSEEEALPKPPFSPDTSPMSRNESIILMRGSQLETSEVKTFSTPYDVNRMKEWAVGMAKHGVSSRDYIIQTLQSELATIKDTNEHQKMRISELEKEVKAHSSTSKMTKTELDSCNEKLTELNRNRIELELQLEEAVSQRKELERRLVQSAAKVDALTHDKDNIGANTSSLEEANRNLKYELEEARQELQLLQMELTKKQNSACKLEMQLHTIEEEAEILREKITHLESIKLENEKEMAEQTLSIDTLKMENSNLQRELVQLHETEATTIGALTEVQAINKGLEHKKRQLMKSLRVVNDKQVKLDEANIELEKVKVSKEDQLEKLKDERSYLSEQVDELDRSLGETELLKMDVQCERDQLKQEVAALSEALGKSKQALAEVQIQRGKLNNKIATMAQEKGNMITSKVELSAEVVKLQESLEMSSKRVTSIRVIKDRLTQKVEDLEQKLSQSEMAASLLKEEKMVLLQEKHDLQVKMDEVIAEKDTEISSLHKQKSVELQHEKLTAKSQEEKLRSAMKLQADIAQKELSLAKQTQADEVASLTQQHEELTAQLREELESFSKMHSDEVSCRQKDMEMASSRWEKERLLLNDRITKLQKMLDEKSEDLVQQQHHSNNVAAEQRAQLDVSNLNAQRLERELVTSEKRLWDLQSKLDAVKKDTADQINSLKSQLSDVSDSVTKLEASNDDAKMTIKTLENQNCALQRHNMDIQRQLTSALEDKKHLSTECHSLEKKLSLASIELSRLHETVNNLREKFSKAAQDLSIAEKDASQTHQSLSGVEQAHAKLVTEHAVLQSSLTSLEKEATSLKLELNNSQESIGQLSKTKEMLTTRLAALEDNFKVVSEKCQLKEQEAASVRLRATHLEKEKHELASNLSKIKEQSDIQSRQDEAKLSDYESTISDLKSLQDHFQDKITSLETALESSQAAKLELDSKLETADKQATSVTSYLKESDALRKDLQSKYGTLLGVLEGTLGIAPSIDDESMDVFSPSVPAASFSFSITESRPESGFCGSFSSSANSPEDNLGGVFKDEHLHTKNPSKLSKLKLDANAVRDEILDLQKRVMLAERAEREAIASVTESKKTVTRLEEEKSSLEARLKSLRSSLTSLQTSFDSVSKQRNQAELSLKLQTSSLSDHEKQGKDLQEEVMSLRKQIETDRAAKKESESKFKEYVSTQVNLELDRNKLESKTKQLELQRRQLEEEIVKLKTQLSELESTHVKKDAEIAHLQQKLVTNQHLYLQIEEQLKALKETNQSLESSYKLSQESDKRLIEKIKQLELKLVWTQSDKQALEKKIKKLEEDLALAKKGKQLLEDDLRILAQNQLQSDTERIQLQEKVKELNASLSNQEISKAQQLTQLQSVEMKLQEQEGQKQIMECRLSDLISEKMEMRAHVQQLEGDLTTAVKEKQIASDLCGSLEVEIDHMKDSFDRLQDEQSKLKNDYQETAMQNSRLDTLITNQQKQKTQLDQSLVESSKQNIELMKTVRGLKESMATKEREQEQKLKVMTSQVGQIQGEMRMHESVWAGKEKGYKKTIQKLETKVNKLESKLNEAKKKKATFLQKAHDHDKTIQSMRSTVDDSIASLATGQAHIPSFIERESVKLTSSINGHCFSPSPSSSVSQSPSRYSYSYSYSPSPSRVSLDVHGPYTSTPMKQ